MFLILIFLYPLVSFKYILHNFFCLFLYFFDVRLCIREHHIVKVFQYFYSKRSFLEGLVFDLMNNLYFIYERYLYFFALFFIFCFDLMLIIDKFGIIHRGWIKTFYFIRSFYGSINHHQLLNENVLHNIVAFYQPFIVKNN